jgi:prepilin-type N-terminal cleavage/methylation domain-containing protein
MKTTSITHPASLSKHALRSTPLAPRPSPLSLRAFTLIELLVVISIIALLAALIFPITGAVNKAKIKARARGELKGVELAIERYKTKLGSYPPSLTNWSAPNTLYYELLGTRLQTNTYYVLDGSATITPTDVNTFFGFAGFANCSKGASEEGQDAVNFFHNLRAGQFLAVTNPDCSVLGASLEGPMNYQSPALKKINPWRYNSAAPYYNRDSFDLWIDVNIGKTTYRFSNWSKDPTIVLPPYGYPF